MLIARPPSFRKLLSRLTRRAGDLEVCVADKPANEETLPTLAEAIVGSDKSAIVSALGPPRGAVASGDSVQRTQTFWQASTWYYPVPRNERMAMAIGFEKGYACRVDFFQARAA